MNKFSLFIIAMILAGIAFFYLVPQPSAVQKTETEASLPITILSAPAKNPHARFTDISEQAGIHFVHINGAYGEKLMPETMGSGVAFFDYDNDHDQDLLLVNARYWEGHEPAGAARPTTMLYQNDGQGHFQPVSVGLELYQYGMGVAVGDYDNDGWVDVYLTALGNNHLLHNQQGQFIEVTETAGVAGLPEEWSTTAVFFDMDNDGDLDLFVGNYVQWSRKIDLEIDFRLTGLGRAYGAPKNFVGSNSRLYRNEGNGQFIDLSDNIAVHDPHSGRPVGKALGVATVDYDSDGLLDLFIANDTVRNFLLHNLGNGRFEEIGGLEGFAFDRNGKATSAMGIDASWYRNDQELGIATGNFANEMNSLYVTADGLAPFVDEAVLEGYGPNSRLALTFGIFFFDYDLDGWQDLLLANGHLENDINQVQPSQHYAQPAQLFRQCADCEQRFIPVEQSGDLTQPLVARAASYADIDNDGDLDILLTQAGRASRLFRNDQSANNHWLRVKLIGKTVNRDAIGAQLELTANGVMQHRLVMPTRSYLSQVELPVSFGLGKTDQIDALKITWPDGSVQNVEVNQIDTTLQIEQAVE